MVAFAAFWPALGNGFVDWDDQVFLEKNYRYRGLSAEHLRWMFTEFHEGHYQPLSWVTYGLDYLLWGMDPKGYHLGNIVLHAVNAVLVYLLALRLLRCTVAADSPGKPSTSLVLGAMIAALVFALHPMRVESVAWATERRDVLSGFFYLLTVWVYVGACLRRPDRRPGMLRLLLCWVLACAALLSKVMCVSLPVVLIVLDVYPLRRVSGDPLRWLSKRSCRVWGEKVPILALVAGFMVVAVLAGTRAISSLDQFDLVERLAIAAYGYAFYVYKMVWPVVLLPLYEMPVEFEPTEWRFLLSAGFVVAFSAAWLILRRRLPGLLSAWVCYVVVLLPVVGLVQVGPQLVADRYTYHSCVGWAVLVGGLVAKLMTKRPTGRGAAPVGVISLALSLAVVVVLGVKTWRQTRVWQDSESLWSHVLAHDAKSSRAHNGLGLVRFEQGRIDEALELFRKAARLRPRLAEAYINIGLALKEQGDIQGAIRSFEQALEVHPGYADAVFNLGQMKAVRGDIDGAIAHYQRALQAKPDTPEIHINLGALLATRRNFQEAEMHFRIAAKLNPESPDAYTNLGIILRAQGKLDEALTVLQRAIALDPQSPKARKNLGDLYSTEQRWDRAIEQYEHALTFDPDYAGAHFKLANALKETGRLDEAIAHYEWAVELEPQNSIMRAGLDGALQSTGK